VLRSFRCGFKRLLNNDIRDTLAKSVLNIEALRNACGYIYIYTTMILGTIMDKYVIGTSVAK